MVSSLRTGIRHLTKSRGSNIPEAKARDHIFGYTIFNDFSARHAQRMEMEGRWGPAKGKSFDGGNVLGPWIVTPDEIGDPCKLKMEAASTARFVRMARAKACCFRSRKSSPTSPGMRR